MTLVFEKLLHHYQVYWSKHLDMSRKMEVDYHGQRWASLFLCKDGAKPSDIHRRLSSVCGQKSPARSTELQNWQSN
jgi:hypothetical protein